MIFTFKLPMQGPLKYINAYLIRDDNESLLIDTGLPTQEDITVLNSYLKQYGFPDLVAVTHYHPDHIGLVKMFKDKRIIISEKEVEFLNYILSDDFEREMREYLYENGFPEDYVQLLLRSRNRIGEIINDVEFDTVNEGDVIKLGQSQIKIILTPGHTTGHMCLLYGENYLFCGDHILRGITPNVSLLKLGDNPLQDYLESLDKVEKFNVKKVYPAHGDPFDDVGKRVEEIKKHHEERLDEIVNIIKIKGEANGFEIATSISWYKKWEDLSVFDKQLAMGETLAHIKYMVEKDVLKEIRKGSAIYYKLVG